MYSFRYLSISCFAKTRKRYLLTYTTKVLSRNLAWLTSCSCSMNPGVKSSPTIKITQKLQSWCELGNRFLTYLVQRLWNIKWLILVYSFLTNPAHEIFNEFNGCFLWHAFKLLALSAGTANILMSNFTR